MARTEPIRDFEVFGHFYVTWNKNEGTRSIYSQNDKINPIATVPDGDLNEELKVLESEGW